MGKPDDIVIIVDENDNVLGNVLRKDTTPHDRWRDTAVFLFNTSGDVLMAQRHKNKKVLPNKWGPAVSGTVESHESYAENARKELQEELGLTDIQLHSVGTFKMDYDLLKRYTGLFVGIWDGEPSTLILEENQVQAVQWMRESQLTFRIKKEPEIFVPKVYDLFLLARNYLQTLK